MNAPVPITDPSEQAISSVVDEIVRMVHPLRIYLYNHRYSAAGATTGFKLCVVGDFSDKARVEHDIYLGVDSEVSFDIILYTPFEWDSLLARSESFASRIALSGTVVYG